MALERVATLEEELATANQEVGYQTDTTTTVIMLDI